MDYLFQIFTQVSLNITLKNHRILIVKCINIETQKRSLLL